MGEISENVIRAYALENAIKYGGKANQGAVLSGLFSEGLEKSGVKSIILKIQKILREVNSFSLNEQKKRFELLGNKTRKREVREGLPELDNVEKGRVVMRFAPFPSGPLHIGNARPLILNDEYVKRYGGKLILVMDDTIGSEAKPIEPEAYKLIEEGVKWLGVEYDKNIIYKSDRIEKYYDYAYELIKKGYMYVCFCVQEKIRDLRLKGEECSCRQFHASDNLKKWVKMFDAEEGSMVIRLKTSMSDPDPAFRDRVMFRISDRPHAKLGKKYRVYPLLDFSWAIDDHFLGITHILRGMELAIETRVEKFIWDIFNWKHPEVIYNGHFEIDGVKLSKSKGAIEVKSGKYSGWNDPRTWSLQSLRDRGFSPEAIRQFILNMGLKKTNIKIPVYVLYSLNKKMLNESPKYFFVENPRKIKICGSPELSIEIPFHPNGKIGSRKFNTSQEFLISEKDYNLMDDGNYRLMKLFNFKSDKVQRIKPREFSFVSRESEKNEKIKFMEWLVSGSENVKVRIRMPDGLFLEGLGESSLNDLKIGSVIYFERVGFVRLYSIDKKSGEMEFWLGHF
jgi:glutamyl-tRNA synthetase